MALKEPAFVLRIRINPEDNVLVGAQDIMRYLKINSFVTLYRWIEDAGLPCVKRLDGKWMTTMTAIDQWIVLCHEIGSATQKRRANHADLGISHQRPMSPRQFAYVDYQEKYGDAYNGNKARDQRPGPIQALDGREDDIPAEIRAGGPPDA